MLYPFSEMECYIHSQKWNMYVYSHICSHMFVLRNGMFGNAWRKVRQIWRIPAPHSNGRSLAVSYTVNAYTVYAINECVSLMIVLACFDSTSVSALSLNLSNKRTCFDLYKKHILSTGCRTAHFGW